VAYSDLTYLKTITEGNKEILREMIEIFLMEVPQYILNLNNFYQSGQFEALGREAHKAKSSLQIVGMTELEKEMKIIELKVQEGADLEGCINYIRHFEIQTQAAIKELQAVLAAL
jgi:HPt (histidine-containing phosphotransfer) domain-containing protein